MTAPRSSPDRRAAYVVLILLVAGSFLVALTVPYRVDSDAGFQMRSLQQWLRGESPSAGTLRLPYPTDLSRDTLVWSSWWPPGFPFIYALPAAAGLSLAYTLRLTSFLCFLLGVIGWMRLADGLSLSQPARLLYAVSLAAYAVTSGGAATLRSADNLSFAAAPWLALAVLRLSRSPRSYAALFFCGSALGASYFLKYTLFFAALALAAWLGIQVLLESQGTRAEKLARLSALGLGLALPVAALIALNFWQSGSLSESASGARSIWRAEDLRSAQPLPVALGVLGGPGLGLFQSHLWISHLVYFSDRMIPWLRRLDTFQRLLLQASAGVVGTLALVWTLWTARRIQPQSRHWSLALTAVAVFYVALGTVSLVIKYNYPAQEPRYGIAIMPLLQPFVLAAWLAASNRPSRRAVRVLALSLFTAFFLAPLLFAAGYFLKAEIRDRLTLGYQSSSTGLYVPEISSRDVPQVQAAIAAIVRSPRDVVVLAGPAGTAASFTMWLESPWRTLPITTFCLPLGSRYLQVADLRGTQALTTSQPLRVVLVASLSLEQDGWLSRLRGRFSQAGTWTAIPPIRNSNVGIWFSDLQVR
jgi:hypothetical protein